MDKRYQVFVSSTYTDLKEERAEIIQTIMELDCIPAGMELFPALDIEQFEFIKKVIDDCDYYVLIIGGRYGSLSPEGISYTEMEYDYAVKTGKWVIALVHNEPGAIPASKVELDPVLSEKLDSFRQKVCNSRLVRMWSDAKDLPSLVTKGLVQTIKIHPMPGWIRGGDKTPEQLKEEILTLKNKNFAQTEKIRKLEQTDSNNYDCLQAGGKYLLKIKQNGRYVGDEGLEDEYVCELELEKIFKIIGDVIYPVKGSEFKIQRSLLSAVMEENQLIGVPATCFNLSEYESTQLAIELEAHKLFEIFGQGSESYWRFTKASRKAYIRMNAKTTEW